MDVEVLRRDPNAPGWSGALEASWALARGNLERVEVGGKGQLQLQTLFPHAERSRPPFVRARVLAIASGAYAKAEGVTVASQAFGHVRSTAMWWPRVGTEVYAQVQRDDFLRLQGRFVVGAGPRFVIVHEDAIELEAGTSLMPEVERYDDEAGLPTSNERRALRTSNLVVLRLASPAKTFVGQVSSYLQPRIDAPTDLRWLSNVGLDVHATDHLSFGLRVSFLHDTRPPAGVERSDVRVTNTIKAEL